MSFHLKARVIGWDMAYDFIFLTLSFTCGWHAQTQHVKLICYCMVGINFHLKYFALMSSKSLTWPEFIFLIYYQMSCPFEGKHTNTFNKPITKKQRKTVEITGNCSSNPPERYPRKLLFVQQTIKQNIWFVLKRTSKKSETWRLLEAKFN